MIDNVHMQTFKEVVRHAAFRLGLADFLDTRRQKRGLKTDHLKAPTAAERFQAIYATHAWVHQDSQLSGSGIGSEMSATESVRSQLVDIIHELDCRLFLDVGCGDWTWMKHVSLPCSYHGIDIVPEIIAANRKHEGPGVSFQLLNAIEADLPQADIAFCREVLFHLSFEDGQKVLKNIRKSCRYLIATTNNLWFNSNIRTGDFRNINLCRSPYFLPEPDKHIEDGSISTGRRLGIWPTDAIPDY